MSIYQSPLFYATVFLALNFMRWWSKENIFEPNGGAIIYFIIAIVVVTAFALSFGIDYLIRTRDWSLFIKLSLQGTLSFILLVLAWQVNW